MFKVGDKVEILKHNATRAGVYKGQRGIVTKELSPNGSYRIKMLSDYVDKDFNNRIWATGVEWQIYGYQLKKVEDIVISKEEDYYTWLSKR